MSRDAPCSRPRLSHTIMMPAVLVILLMAAPALAAPKHVVMFSQYIRPGDSFIVDINLLPGAPGITVTVDVGEGNERSFTSKVTGSASILSGNNGQIELMIPAGLEPSQNGYSVRIMGLNETTVFEGLELLTKTSSVFVQTDKGTYKPGDIVKFRVVVVNSDMVPLNQPISIKINNPAGNAIQQWLDQTPSGGLFQNDVELPDFVTLGTWTIKVEYGEMTPYDKHFEVEEYVLPRFEVTVMLPSFVVATSFEQTMAITVKAMYTFGQPVQGTADIIIPSPIGTRSVYKLLASELSDEGTFTTHVTLRDICQDCRDVNQLTYSNVVVIGNVTETGTSTTLSGSSSPLFSRQGAKVEFLDATAETFKPGFSYTVYVLMTEPDGRPLDVSNNAPNVILAGSVSCAWNTEVPCTTYTISEMTEPLTQSGAVTFTLSLSEVQEGHNNMNLNVRARDPVTGTDITASKSVSVFESESNEAIQVTQRAAPDAVSATVEPNTQVTFDVITSADVTHIFYQVFGRSLLVLGGRSPTVAAMKSHSFTLDVTSVVAKQLSPTARIIVSYVTASGELVTDTKQLSVAGALANHVTVGYSEDTVEPGMPVGISGEAEAGSFVALLVVDQSVLLLSGGNDITMDTVVAEIAEYDAVSSSSSGGGGCFGIGWRRRRRRSVMPPCYFNAGTSTADLLRNSKVIAVTDALIYGGENSNQYVYMARFPNAEFDMMDEDVSANAGPAPPSAGATADDGAMPSDSLEPVGQVRTEFLETWLFDIVLTGDDGRYSMPATPVPDTITSWVASAFALHPTVGLGIAEQSTLTTFKPFFVTLTLPYNIIRGEVFLLKASVFNYLTSTQSVTVTLKQSNEFDYVDSANNGTHSQNDVIISLVVSPQSAKTAEFWIEPVALGDIAIEVHAQSTQASDALRRTVLVKPEGEEKEISKSELITLTADESVDKTFIPNFPEDVIMDSRKIFFKVVGNALGPAMANLDNLLRMPTGCGEQTMIGLAPDVFVTRYLKATDQLESEIYNKAIKFMKSGYARELTYKHNNGGFSAFGESDQSASSWLTAFVVKVFHEAGEFINIDPVVIEEALRWILQQQNADGSFNVVGTVHHAELMGGSSDGVSFSSYVTMALVENEDFSSHTGLSDLASKTQLAVQYLESQLSSQSDNSYSLALLSYVLARAQSSQADAAFTMLNAKAIIKDGMKYWTESGEEETTPPPSNRWSYSGTPSTSIETTGYALLATLLHENGIVEGIPISKWLTSKQNSLGGYTSTQDTVVALWALTEFTLATVSESEGQNLAISVMGGNENILFETITDENKDILQVHEFSGDVSQLVMTATGPGSAVVKFVTEFNIPTSEPSGNIELQVTVEDTTDPNKVDVRSCFRWTSSDEESGMSIMQVSSLSGFANDREGLIDEYRSMGLKMAEVKDNNLVLYWDQIPQDELCVKTTQHREFSVTGLQHAYVSAYSYYKPTSVQSVRYLPESLSAVDPCLMCPTCTRCDTSAATMIYPRSTLLAVLLVMVARFLL